MPRSKMRNPDCEHVAAIRNPTATTAVCETKPNRLQFPPFHDSAGWLEKKVEIISEISCAAVRRQKQQPNPSAHKRRAGLNVISRRNNSSPIAVPISATATFGVTS